MFWPWSSPAPLVTLRGQNVVLRLPQMHDYEAWYTLRRASQDFLRPFEPRWTELDLARRVFALRVRRARQEAEEGTDYTFFIFMEREGQDQLVGGITLSNIRRRAAQFVNLGYWMGQNYAGKGIMTEAVGVVLPFIFDTLDLHRVHAAFIPTNTPSRRVLEKNGFAEEGYAQRYLQINGRWEDHVLMGLTQETWSLNRLSPRSRVA
ncbi:[SSU ribosomal protein S5P]-alanine acetyltransferase [Devosia lucknowensis]|uniref:[SSU ribosomal protein S5P]-alanine acetyltransferase n=1 Tax=Devosia lucknowensis TaxID=1096929 RepID=A0A1Y6EAY3_9HYPH|nr:GNAT family protein [Devosia lucknowensis]SMQ59686.1 [SSU ribosomal protein S5P]-alanine acetyltransferase [Devosia lucknowensis]